MCQLAVLHTVPISPPESYKRGPKSQTGTWPVHQRLSPKFVGHSETVFLSWSRPQSFFTTMIIFNAHSPFTPYSKLTLEDFKFTAADLPQDLETWYVLYEPSLYCIFTLPIPTTSIALIEGILRIVAVLSSGSHNRFVSCPWAFISLQSDHFNCANSEVQLYVWL